MNLTDLDVASPLSYLVAFALPALDAILPVLPSETAVVALGVATAGRWDLRIPVLVAVAAIGAFTGDNVAYLIGRRGSAWANRRLLSGPRGAKRLDWAVRTLDRHGAKLVVVCRFLPGGRTAVTLACGLTGFPRRRFVPATAFAAVIWATYAFLIGRIGGSALADRPWAGLALALGLAVAATGLIEVGRRVVGRIWRRVDEAPAPSPATRDGGRADRAGSDGVGAGGSPADRPESKAPDSIGAGSIGAGSIGAGWTGPGASAAGAWGPAEGVEP